MWPIISIQRHWRSTANTASTSRPLRVTVTTSCLYQRSLSSINRALSALSMPILITRRGSVRTPCLTLHNESPVLTSRVAAAVGGGRHVPPMVVAALARDRGRRGGPQRWRPDEDHPSEGKTQDRVPGTSLATRVAGDG